MGVLEELADALADDTMKAQNKLDEPYLYEEVAKVLGAASTTLEEAYLTSMRVRIAEKRGRLFLEKRIKDLIARKKAQQDSAS
ncbi:hypothetical protein VK792_16945 [Mesobacterium sp. TK19101]|uniref:Uncharacterized protein n=1 Tax=Mesobacterium hydrothermale TaxID=3111907 RepID=A0ABU6HKJ2_9RHOB|nr:hypothetical protein [Mesobacterium sp. TK19101]MEC3862983.1 hypothetical protein [Mesobacterium sp. TK19101]